MKNWCNIAIPIVIVAFFTSALVSSAPSMSDVQGMNFFLFFPSLLIIIGTRHLSRYVLSEFLRTSIGIFIYVVGLYYIKFSYSENSSVIKID